MNPQPPDAKPLLTPAEVAAMFRVDPKTVTRWAKPGKLTSIRTLDGHPRYLEAEILSILNRSAQTGPGQPAGLGQPVMTTPGRSPAVASAGDRRPGR